MFWFNLNDLVINIDLPTSGTGASSPLMNLIFFFLSLNRPEYDLFIFFWVNTCLPLLPACYPWLVEGKRLSLLRGVVFSLWLPSCMGIHVLS